MEEKKTEVVSDPANPNNLKIKKQSKLVKEFKSFITRGNVVDMAVGVIMGSAFGSIVTSVTNILLSVCTWSVPGGLSGLITVLPALNNSQKGLSAATGLGQTFQAADLQDLAKAYAVSLYGDANPTAAIIESMKTTILSKYSLYGTTYVYNQSATINWGAFINAVISFLIIALTLFVILKVFTYLQAKRKNYEAQIQLKSGFMYEDAYNAKKAELEKQAKDAEAANQAKLALEKEENMKQEQLDTLKAIKELLEKQGK